MADWRPMSEFDPDKPGPLVHGGHRDLGHAVIERDGFLLDGWMELPRLTRDEKQQIDDDFYDDFPEVKRSTEEVQCTPVSDLGHPINSRVRSPHGENLMPTRDWKCWIGALVACGLLTWFVPFGMVTGVALLALCVHLLDRRQERIGEAQLIACRARPEPAPISFRWAKERTIP